MTPNLIAIFVLATLADVMLFVIVWMMDAQEEGCGRCPFR